MQNFNNRAEYLVAVAMWKEEYAALTVQIRAVKTAYKNAQRELSLCGSYNYNANSSDPSNAKHLAASRLVNKAISDRASLKAAARDLLDERSEGKLEAQRQYERSRETC